MAEKLMKDHLYGDLLAPASGYSTDFAMGMTYSLSFDALLTTYLAFGMLGEMDENIIQSPHILLEAINKSSEKVVVFCNKGGIAVPSKIRKVYSLLEQNIFEVFNKKDHRANFHPKLWLIREVSKDNKDDVQLKLIVTSRNLAYTDTIDCVACLTGKVGTQAINTKKHQPLISFIKAIVGESNISGEQKKSVLQLCEDLKHVKRFNVEAPFEDYDFFPYVFKKNGEQRKLDKSLIGTESIIVSPFIDKSMIARLNSENKSRCILITRKEYVDQKIFDQFNNRGGIYVALDDLVSRGIDLHAKMYHVWNGRNAQYLFLGSANATTSAFERNVEFLLRLKYKSGNARINQFLSNFYEKGNDDSKFMPLKEPIETATPNITWDPAEIAMKDLMCADDLIAHITHHRDGYYSIVVSSKKTSNDVEVFIAPLQKEVLKQLWTGRVAFDQMKAEELSEFYIISAKTIEGVEHKSIIKIATSGMPSEREQRIYKSIINKSNFYQFLELMLTDTPIEYISSEMHLIKERKVGSSCNDERQYPCIYEEMLKIAATNPVQFNEIGKLIEKLGKDEVPESFMKIYKQFVNALS